MISLFRFRNITVSIVCLLIAQITILQQEAVAQIRPISGLSNPDLVCVQPSVNAHAGLIKICYLEDLDAIRWALDGSAYKRGSDAPADTTGCPSSGCVGYIMARTLDFNDATSYRSGVVNTEWTSGAGWQPIGTSTEPFSGRFVGSSYRLLNLRINRPNEDNIGLFGAISDTARVERAILLKADVVGRENVGGLVGMNKGAVHNNASIGGRVIASQETVGGLVGLNDEGSSIVNSYTNVQTSIIAATEVRSANVGGLVGINRDGAMVSHSYASGSVSGPCGVGGLVGLHSTSDPSDIAKISTIINSYAAGAVTTAVGNCGESRDIFAGGLVGQSINSPIEYSYATAVVSGTRGALGGLVAITSGVARVTESYWNQSVNSALGNADDRGRTTAQMQTETTTTHTYHSWSVSDWDFGTDKHYPMLRYGGDDVDACGNNPRGILPVCGNLIAPQIKYGLSDLTVAHNGELSPTYSMSHQSGDYVGTVHQFGKVFQLIPTMTDSDRSRFIIIYYIGSLPIDAPNHRLTEGKQELNVNIKSGEATNLILASDDLPPIDIVRFFDDGTFVRHTLIFDYEDKASEGEDANGNALIDINYLEDLDAVRDLDARRSPSTLGFELLRDLDFKDDRHYRNPANKVFWDIDVADETTRSIGWQPIGTADDEFDGVFVGAMHTIRNLQINRPREDNVGLFGVVSDTARIDGVVLLRATVVGRSNSGALIGSNKGLVHNSSVLGGRVVGVQGATGGLIGLNDAGGSGVGSVVNSHANIPVSIKLSSVKRAANVGGLVGVNRSGATISNSYASGVVSGPCGVGGLVGFHVTSSASTSTESSKISNSYASGSVTTAVGDCDQDANIRAAGLVANSVNSVIEYSYAIGAVSGTRGTLNGLVASVFGDAPITDSYWNRTDNTELASDTRGHFEALLKLPTTTTGIYSNWSNDDWYFGTAEQYPTLRYTAGKDLPACGGGAALPNCGELISPQINYGLSDLTVSHGGKLSPSYASSHQSGNYAGTVRQFGNLIRLIPTPLDPTEQVTIYIGDRVLDTGLEFGEPSSVIALGSDTPPIVIAMDSRPTIRHTVILDYERETIEEDADRDGLVEINYLEDLDAMRYSDQSGFELMRHLDFNDPDSYRNPLNQIVWTEVDDPNIDIEFQSSFPSILGTFEEFNGNAYTISNLWQVDEGNDVGGLFSIIPETALVQQIGLLNVKITVGIAAAGLIYENLGSIVNSYVIGDIASKGDAGGLVVLNEGKILNSHAVARVVGRNAAGLALNHHGGIIANSYAAGIVSGVGDGVGGLVGDMRGDAGAILLQNSYATSEIVEDPDLFTVGRVAGGLVGESIVSLKNTYAMGSIYGRGSIGGLIGSARLTSGAEKDVRISTSYAIAKVLDDGRRGSLVSKILSSDRASVSIIASYANETNNPGVSLVGSGADIIRDSFLLSTEQMQTPTAPGTTSTEAYYQWHTDDWDFGTDEDYPILKYAAGSDGDACDMDADTPLPRCGDLIAPEIRHGLTGLTVGGTDELSPPFGSSDQLHYGHYFGTAVAEDNAIRLIPSAAQAGTPIKFYINTLKDTPDYSLSSGDTSGEITLTDGITRIIAEVGTRTPAVYYPIYLFYEQVDHDRDDDGLIEIDYLEDLDAMRYQLDGSGYKASEAAPLVQIGCPDDGCIGYELSRDLDFNDVASYRDASHKMTLDGNWQPIGSADRPFAGIFKGNNYTLSNLVIKPSDDGSSGLFGATTASAVIDGVGLVDAAISVEHSADTEIAVSRTGFLVAWNQGAIRNSYAIGRITVHNRNSALTTVMGGLVGVNEGPMAQIQNCYVKAQIDQFIHANALFNRVGGLVGSNLKQALISNSYTNVAVAIKNLYDNSSNFVTIESGALLGLNQATIRDSYALGSVKASNFIAAQSYIGGLVGRQLAGTTTNSYWDVEVSGIASGFGTSLSTVALLSPTAPQSSEVAQAYYAWDSAAWDFGTPGQYPRLNYVDDSCATSQPSPHCGLPLGNQGELLRRVVLSAGSGLSSRFSPFVSDYHVASNADQDSIEITPTAFNPEVIVAISRDGEELIEEIASGGSVVIVLEQAQTTVTMTTGGSSRPAVEYRFVIHHLERTVDVDADDDGLIEINFLEDLNAMRYQPDGSAYRATMDSLKLSIGCPRSGCNGYELAVDLDFAAAESYRSTETSYYTADEGWIPIEFFDARFDGNDRTIANLKVNRSGRGGLFGYLAVGSNISGVGLADVNIEGGSQVGGLVAYAAADSEVVDCYASGIVMGTGSNIGGLIGNSDGLVSGSYSTVDVSGMSNRVGGLVGRGHRIVASHARGEVTGTGEDIGGLVGLLSGELINSYASGRVEGGQQVGGLVGSLSGELISLRNSYAVGDVVGDRSVGGLVGATDSSLQSSRTLVNRVSNCYAIGRVTGSDAVGGLLGRSVGSFDSAMLERSEFPVWISSSYWNVDTSGQTQSTGQIDAPQFSHQEGIGLGTEAMQMPTAPSSTTATGAYYNWSLADWDFGNMFQYPAIKRNDGSNFLLDGQRIALEDLVLIVGDEERTLPSNTIEPIQRKVPFDVSCITLKWTIATSATVVVNGVPTSDDEAQECGLEVLDPKTITIALVPQRGSTPTQSDVIDSGSTRTYVIVIVRQSSTDLKDIALSDGVELEPDFARDELSYRVIIANDQATVTVTPSALDPGATIEAMVDDDPVDPVDDSGAIMIALEEGESIVLKITVMARDAEAKEYTVSILRALRANADLASLSLSEGTLAPEFVAEVSRYDGLVTVIESITLSALAADAEATLAVAVNAAEVRDEGGGNYEIMLTPEGITTVAVIVRAQDGITTKSYTVAIRHRFAQGSELSAMRLSDEVGQAIPLAQPFRPNRYEYDAEVFAASHVTVSPTAATEEATITVNDATVPSGTTSPAVELNLGTTTWIAIEVSLPDSNQPTGYTLGVKQIPNSEAELKELILSGGTLLPPFSPEIREYKITTITASLITVVPTASLGSRIAVNDTPVANGTSTPIKLTGTNTEIIIAITSQDGKNRSDYIFTASLPQMPGIRIRSKVYLESTLP